MRKNRIFSWMGYWISVVIVGIIFGVTIQFVRAWTEPTAAPPSGNVGAPVTTGNNTQTKLGNLQLNSSAAPFPIGLIVSNGNSIVANGNLGIGTLSPAQRLHVVGNTQIDGAIVAPEGTLRDDGGGWIRTYGATGWYSQTYGGGWYMTDTTWLRAYGNKNIYTPNTIQAGANMYSPIYYDLNDGGYYVDPNGTSRINYTVANNAYAYGWMQAAIFYDANDNNFYVDPNGTSRLANVSIVGPTWHNNNWLYDGYLSHNDCRWSSGDYMRCPNGFYMAGIDEIGYNVDQFLCCRI